MGKSLEQKISRFDAGIADDARTPVGSGAALIKHFDVFSNPHKLTPYRSVEADHATNVSATDAKQYDIYKPTLASTGLLYGLGKNTSGFPKVLRKADPTTGNWLSSAGSNAATAEGEGNAARITGCFIEWASAFFFLQGTNQIAKVALTGAITNSVSTTGTTIVTTAQGVVFGNKLYIPYNNKVFSVASDGSTVVDDVTPALPSDMRITSMSVWGNYIMIGMAYGTGVNASPTGRSKVYQWDGSSTSEFKDIIDWGEGALQCLGNIEGMICGVSNKYLETPSGLTSLALGGGSMVVRLWGGGVPRVVKEIVGNQSVTLGRMLNEVVIKGNKMYWVASVPFGLSTSTESTHNLGIWAFGRKNQNSNFSVTLDYIANSLIDTSNFKINSFGNAGNYWFINHSADGSLAKTDDSATYSETSTYDTVIMNMDDSSVTKKLVGVTLYTVPLPTAGSVTVAYRADAETSYTTIFTFADDDGIRHSAINIESSEAQLPDFKELQLRVTSTGGAEITGLRFKAQIIEDDIYQ